MSESKGPNVFLRAIARLFSQGWHRLAKERVELPDGPLILVGNHICGLDPILIQATVNRPLSFLMAREYYQSMWYIRWGFDMVGAIPVSPGGANRQALQKAIEVVEQGNVLCIFPEGAANPPIPLHKILPGAAMISRETGAPIIPFRISGVWPFDHIHMWRPFYRRSRARIVVGNPLLMGDQKEGKEGILADTQVIRHAIRDLSRFDVSPDL
ncbi:lysophospholipid acyltransferase family protein [Mariprofundus micogutta]|uniref:lysophospholipid acyltransferase family protein n=1 Tax=Mariprofundus micogutta TaxID=1921010 RepID=UPI001D12DCD3|nr:lysophospholipid acyltransferase family protein [Mariprofundus micogutta]